MTHNLGVKNQVSAVCGMIDEFGSAIDMHSIVSGQDTKF